jgi:hypothetical protein
MYFTSSGQRVKQVLLTPLAVVTDVTVVGGVVSWFVFAYTDAYRCLEPKSQR